MMALAPGYRDHGPVRTAYVAIMQATGTGKDMKRTGGVYRTTDGGTTWAAIGSPGPMDEGVLALAVASDGRMFAAFLTSHVQGGLLCSTDGGQTWQVACPAVGGGAGGAPPANATKATNAPSCTGTGCGGAGANTPAAAATTSAGALPGTGSGAGPAAIGGNLAGTQPANGKPWLLPLLVAAALVAAAATTTVIRRRRPGSA